MRYLFFAVAIGSLAMNGCSNAPGPGSSEMSAETVTERNKRLAKEFYEELWFTNNTDAYSKYVATEYVVHDVGDRKNVTEPAVAQKEIADVFHSFGEMSGEIDYQISEDDKVATRWFISLVPDEAGKAKGMTEVSRVAIINVFRFDQSGKIVEIWNHRHDVDLPQPPNGERPE
ncbi:MAG: ester cyclase [Pseudomonadota bacterium]